MTWWARADRCLVLFVLAAIGAVLVPAGSRANAATTEIPWGLYGVVCYL